MTQPLRPAALGAAPGPSFEEPFAMLAACHERIERTLALLARLRDHIRKHGADGQARQAASDVTRYFDLAAPQHHRDEELHVFPRLLAQGDAHTSDVVRRLQQDHGAMESAWAAARTVLARIAAGESVADDAALDAFAGLYADHLAAEQTLVFPAARALMDGPELTAMGEEMARRRGAR